MDFGPKSEVEEGAVVKLGGRFFVIAMSTGKFVCDGQQGHRHLHPGTDLC
jgi:hypothetical protein